MEGIKKLLSAQTAGLPNWAWLLIIGGGIAAAIFVPKLFPNLLGGGTDTGTTTDTGTATPTDTGGGYTPVGPGAGGGGGTTTDGTGTTPTTTLPPTPAPTTDGTNPPATVFPPIQPGPPPPPTGTAPPDQCKKRQECIDFHLAHTCNPMKTEKERERCRQHWITKCNADHPCGHSLIPSVHETNDVWPHNRQPRRNMAYMIDGRPVRGEDVEKSPRIRVDLPPIEETTLEKEEEPNGNI